MNQITLVARVALSTCPQTSWTAEPIYDHNDQRLSVNSMISQLTDQSERAYPKVLVMLVEWGLSGKWPQFRNNTVYFVREILSWWAGHNDDSRPLDDFPSSPPPWKSKYVAAFLNYTALWWYSMERQKWARTIAENAFDLQEHDFKMRHPME